MGADRADPGGARPAEAGAAPDRPRGAFDAIIFRLRTGCQWNRLPGEYPDDSTVHRTFQRWVKLGIFERLWAVVQERCEDLGGFDWEWQAADGWLGKARLGGDAVGPNPTDRAKPGVKRSLLVEADGGPLAIIIAGANVPDAQLLAATIDAIVLERPEPEPDFPQHLCLDKGYDNDTGWEATIDHDYDPHIAMIRDERPPRPKRYKARRWVVERTIGLVGQVPRHPHPLGEGGRQLPRPPPGRLRPALVPPPPPPRAPWLIATPHQTDCHVAPLSV